MPISGISLILAWWVRIRGKDKNNCCCRRIMRAKFPKGYFVARSRTYKVWIMARASQKISGMGEQAIKWYGEHCAVYPLKGGTRKPNMTYVSGIVGIWHPPQ